MMTWPMHVSRYNTILLGKTCLVQFFLRSSAALEFVRRHHRPIAGLSMSTVVLMWYPQHLPDERWHVTCDLWKQVDEALALATVEAIVQRSAGLTFQAAFTDEPPPARQYIAEFKERAAAITAEGGAPSFTRYNGDGSVTGKLGEHKNILVSCAAVAHLRTQVHTISPHPTPPCPSAPFHVLPRPSMSFRALLTPDLAAFSARAVRPGELPRSCNRGIGSIHPSHEHRRMGRSQSSRRPACEWREARAPGTPPRQERPWRVECQMRRVLRGRLQTREESKKRVKSTDAYATVRVTVTPEVVHVQQ